MSLRVDMPLNLGWRFFRGDEPRAWQNRFDDSNWREVVVPHDWSVEEQFNKKHSSGTGYLPGGVGWYRNRFSLPTLSSDNRVTICFGGVYNNSQVWCNGHYLGKRPYGYSEFIYDITHCVNEGENIIVVRVDHAHTGDSRWFTGSGIYRDVSISITGDVCINDYGVFAYYASKGELTIETQLLNCTETNTSVEVRHFVMQKGEGHTVHAVVQATPGLTTLSQTIKIEDPILWSPENPVLYDLRTEVMPEGKAMDYSYIKIGLRDICFNAQKGFFLNGESYKIKGVCLHHDAGCLGAAVRPKVWQRRLEKLKAMGCNAIRMSHNPHMRALYSLCDSMGFLVIDEAFDEWEGVKNKWTTGHNVYPPAHYGYYEDFPVWGEIDLAAMVLRARNHPSVIMWSIGNEIDYPNDPYCHPLFDEVTGNNDKNKPSQERVYDPGRPNAERLVTIAKRLVQTVKKYDKTRPVTAAISFPELSNITGLSSVLDVVGYNYKEQHYENDRKKYPDHIIMGSENGHHLRAWKAVKDNEFISSQFLWTGIDYLGETPRWPSHGSGAGLLDLAGFEKPSYYYRQSLWLDKPVLRLAASYPIHDNAQLVLPWYYNKMCWNFLKDEDVDIVIYTNCDEVELFLNDEPIGKHKNNGGGMPLSVRVKYSPGVLKAIGYLNGETIECNLITTGAPAAISARVWDESIDFDGQDMTHVEFQIIDTEGNPVADAFNILNIRVEGGHLLGLENGNLSDFTPYKESYRMAYNGRLVAYIGAPLESDGDEIRVFADSLGLKGILLKINRR